jgi:hypothetical protein
MPPVAGTSAKIVAAWEQEKQYERIRRTGSRLPAMPAAANAYGVAVYTVWRMRIVLQAAAEAGGSLIGFDPLRMEWRDAVLLQEVAKPIYENRAPDQFRFR